MLYTFMFKTLTKFTIHFLKCEIGEPNLHGSCSTCHSLLVFHFYNIMHKSGAVTLLFKTSFSRWMFYTDTAGQGFFLPVAKSERLTIARSVLQLSALVCKCIQSTTNDSYTPQTRFGFNKLCQVVNWFYFLIISLRHDARVALLYSTAIRLMQ